MRTERLVLSCTCKRGWHVMERNVREIVSIIQNHGAKVGSANAGCILQQRLEHWFQIAGRRTDDLQHLGRCGRLLEGFLEIATSEVDRKSTRLNSSHMSISYAV